MKAKTKPKRKRLVRGKDWHAWAWKFGKDSICETDSLSFFVVDDPKEADPPSHSGKWVRVKFVEVKP